MTSVDVDPSLAKRLDVYREIEAYRKRPLIVYATSTRSGVRAMLDGDAVSQVVEQIRAIGKGHAIDVLVHSYGGDPLAAWRIMSTLRESYEKVSVLVPFSAFSAATLLALGADEIVMHPFAALGPIDPQIQARTPKGEIQFAYEDVGAFLKFVKEHVGLTEQAFLTPIMDKLFSMAEPLTIGAAQRASDLSSEIGERMLRMHMKKEKDLGRAKEIARNLNRSFLNHGDAVSRKRAKDEVGLQIADSDPKLEDLIWRAYAELDAFMELNTPFSHLAVFLGNAAAAATLTPMPSIQLPANAPPPVLNQVWTTVAQQALQPVGPAPEVPYDIVIALVESTRRSASKVLKGKVTAVRQGLEIKVAPLEVCHGWVVSPVPAIPPADAPTPDAAGTKAEPAQGRKPRRR